jgi:CRP-like cAMP-binding protein
VKQPFNVETFLATVNGGRSISKYRKNQTVFRQGELADSVFFIEEGKVKVSVVSEQGKEAGFLRRGLFDGPATALGHGNVDDGMRHHATRQSDHRARDP